MFYDLYIKRQAIKQQESRLYCGKATTQEEEKRREEKRSDHHQSRGRTNMVCSAAPSPVASACSSSPAVGGHKISTVVPASVTGAEVRHELSNMDLAMKLHYLRCVYYFEASSVISELSTPSLKVPMFPLLELHHVAAGRIRRDDESGGRPFVKCNDSGVRIVEARCEGHTLDEWLRRKGVVAVDVDVDVQHKHLVPDKVIGPDLHFSPLVYIQFTRFKCGGLAVGLSWSHLLGDASSASNFINLWGLLLGDKKHLQQQQQQLQDEEDAEPQHQRRSPAHADQKPRPTEAPIIHGRSIKQLVSPNSCWVVPNKVELDSSSFHFTEAKLKSIMQQQYYCKSLMGGDVAAAVVSPFEAISALIWQCLARFRRDQHHHHHQHHHQHQHQHGGHDHHGGANNNIITVCRSRTGGAERSGGRRKNYLANDQIISCVSCAVESNPEDATLLDLAMLIAAGGGGQQEQGGPEEDKDCILYGANLTFVDMEKIDLYGLDLMGQKPVLVNYSIGGVGDEGALLVFQGPPDHATAAGRVVNAILPVEQLKHLRMELARDWGIA